MWQLEAKQQRFWRQISCQTKQDVTKGGVDTQTAGGKQASDGHQTKYNKNRGGELLTTELKAMGNFLEHDTFVGNAFCPKGRAKHKVSDKVFSSRFALGK